MADDCSIVGVDIGRNTIEKLANQIKQNTDPMIHPSIRVEEIGGKQGKQVIVTDVLESNQKPALAFGIAFIRVGKSNQKLGYEGIRNLALQTSKVYWERILMRIKRGGF